MREPRNYACNITIEKTYLVTLSLPDVYGLPRPVTQDVIGIWAAQDRTRNQFASKGGGKREPVLKEQRCLVSSNWSISCSCSGERTKLSNEVVKDAKITEGNS